MEISSTTIFVPARQLATGQALSFSLSPTSNQRTSRRPSATTPTATTTASDTTRWPTLALQ